MFTSRANSGHNPLLPQGSDSSQGIVINDVLEHETFGNLTHPEEAAAAGPVGGEEERARVERAARRTLPELPLEVQVAADYFAGNQYVEIEAAAPNAVAREEEQGPPRENPIASRKELFYAITHHSTSK